jgi:DNA-binding XRE family transcriptional regulator
LRGSLVSRSPLTGHAVSARLEGALLVLCGIRAFVFIAPVQLPRRLCVQDGLPLAADVAAIRDVCGLTQVAFARLLGIARGTLINWEYGRREPDGAARVLLAVAKYEPEAITDHTIT